MTPGPSGAKAARVERELQEGTMTSSSDRGSLMSPGLLKVAERAKRDPDARFNSLAHLVDEAALGRAFTRIRKDAAVGSMAPRRSSTGSTWKIISEGCTSG